MEALLAAFDTNSMSDPGLRHCCGSVVIQFHHPDDAPYPILNPNYVCSARAGTPLGTTFRAVFLRRRRSIPAAVFAAQLDHLLVAAYGEDDAVLVRHRPDELETLLRIALEGILQLGRRAGLTTDQIQGGQEKISELSPQHSLIHSRLTAGRQAADGLRPFARPTGAQNSDSFQGRFLRLRLGLPDAGGTRRRFARGTPFRFGGRS